MYNGFFSSTKPLLEKMDHNDPSYDVLLFSPVFYQTIEDYNSFQQFEPEILQGVE